MNMIKETYERLLMDVTEFDTEAVITTSGVTPGGGGGSGSSNLRFKSLKGLVQFSPSGSSGFSCCCWRFFFDMAVIQKVCPR